MVAGRGTFIADTTDGTVTQDRDPVKSQRVVVNMSEDLLNRQIQDYGLVSPERVKNVVWCFFKKYGSKKLEGQGDNLDPYTESPLHDLSSGPGATSSIVHRYKDVANDVFLPMYYWLVPMCYWLWTLLLSLTGTIHDRVVFSIFFFCKIHIPIFCNRTEDHSPRFLSWIFGLHSNRTENKICFLLVLTHYYWELINR